MFNESFVNGTLEIRVPTGHDPKLIGKLIDTLTLSWCWSFDFRDDLDDENEVKTCSLKNQYEYIKIDFSADGKRTFQNNLEQFGSWLQHTVDEEGANAASQLEKREFSLVFEYNEENQNDSFIGKGSAVLFHRAKTPLKSMKLKSHKYDEFEYTAGNLMEICEYDEEYAKSLFDAEESA